jgi:ABC-type Fe3+ transport system permease subunit
MTTFLTAVISVYVIGGLLVGWLIWDDDKNRNRELIWDDDVADVATTLWLCFLGALVWPVLALIFGPAWLIVRHRKRARGAS